MTTKTTFSKPTHCNFPGCDRDQAARGYCMSHYMQYRRGKALKPLREGDAMEQVAFRVPAELKAKVERAAKQFEIEPSEWWRRAGEEKISRAERAAKRSEWETVTLAELSRALDRKGKKR